MKEISSPSKNSSVFKVQKEVSDYKNLITASNGK
jgi:hypothetical protein